MRPKSESREVVYENNTDLRRIITLMGNKDIEISASIRPPAPTEFWIQKDIL